MNIVVERFIFYYSRAKLFCSILSLFIIFSMGYLMAMHEKIIAFYVSHHHLDFTEQKIMQLKQKISIVSKISQQEKFETNKGLKQRVGSIKRLIRTIKQAHLAQYRINEFLQKNESNIPIKVLDLSLIGEYFQVVSWLTHAMPYFCSLKQVVLRHMQKGMVSLTVKMEVYEE